MFLPSFFLQQFCAFAKRCRCAYRDRHRTGSPEQGTVVAVVTPMPRENNEAAKGTEMQDASVSLGGTERELWSRRQPEAAIPRPALSFPSGFTSTRRVHQGASGPKGPGPQLATSRPLSSAGHSTTLQASKRPVKLAEKREVTWPPRARSLHRDSQGSERAAYQLPCDGPSSAQSCLSGL